MITPGRVTNNIRPTGRPTAISINQWVQLESEETHETSKAGCVAPWATGRKEEKTNTSTCTNNNINFLEESICPKKKKGLAKSH